MNAIYALEKPPPLSVIAKDSKILAIIKFWELRGVSDALWNHEPYEEQVTISEGSQRG